MAQEKERPTATLESGVVHDVYLEHSMYSQVNHFLENLLKHLFSKLIERTVFNIYRKGVGGGGGRGLWATTELYNFIGASGK